MFDDPRKKLQWMEEELLAEEYEEEDEIYDAFNGEFEEDEPQYGDDDLLELVEELTEEASEQPVRNYANGYGRRRNPAVDFSRTVYADEEFDESAAVLVEPRKKKKGIKGLVFLAFLELSGILAIIGWWLHWLI